MDKKPFEILIVDDNRDLAQNIQDILDENGYGTAIAFDGRSAIELGRQKKFDLVLVDIKLPDMDGLMLQEQLSELMQAEYLIITGHGSVESAAAAVSKRQIVGYETKPVDIDHLLALIHQISERKQAEDALRESEEKFRIISEQSLMGILIAQSNRIEYINQTYADVFGYSVEEMLEWQLEDSVKAIHPEDRVFALEQLEKKQTGNKDIVIHYQYRGIKKSGETIWVDNFSRSIVYKGGPADLITIVDITDLKQAEEALRKSEERFALAVQGANDGIWDWDIQNNSLYWSPRLKELLGYADDELDIDFETFESLLHPDDREHTGAAIETHLKDRGLYDVEQRLRTKSSEYRWFRARGQALWDEAGNPVRMVGSTSDITERKRMEEELRNYHEHLEELVKERTAALQQEIEERKRTEVELRHAKEAALYALRAAEAANKLKSEFLANMSHDIRTPLNAVLGFAEILKERLRGFPQYHSFLDGIMDGGRTLLHLINDILDLSRIEAGRLEIRPKAVNLPAVLTEVQYMFSSKVRRKGIRLESHISPDTPDTVLLDGNRLRQILVNLVGNAVKFTEKGNVSLRVYELNELNELDNSRAPKTQKLKNSKTQKLCFEVRDTGIGIPQNEQERMFEPFQQHDPRSPGGTGLGLAITKRLVELMQGSISVESTVNEGTVFRVLLPAARIAVTEEEGTAGKDAAIVNIQFHGSTILLAEDNAPNREVVRTYVASHDLRLIEAENGQEALQMLKHGSAGIDSPLEAGRGVSFPSREGPGVGFRPDLILMDIGMPVMDGYEATQRIKADPELREIPVVALTGYAVKEQKEKYQDLYDAYLSKPISKRDLIATLAEFLPHTKSPGKKRGKEESIPPLRGVQGGVEERSMLEELKDYAAHTGTFPQALLDKLHVELLTRHTEISEVMSLNGMIAFAEAITTVADAFTIPPLKTYGEELLRYTRASNILNMKRLFALFPEIVEIISK